MSARCASPQPIRMGWCMAGHNELVLRAAQRLRHQRAADHRRPAPRELGGAAADATPLAGAVPLLYADRTASNWDLAPWPVDQSQNWTLANGQLLTLRLAVNRAAMSAPPNLWPKRPSSHGNVSNSPVNASSGTYVQVPLSAAYASGRTRWRRSPTACGLARRPSTKSADLRFYRLHRRGIHSEPLPAGGSFPLRLILHAGRDGNYRLLSSAVIAAMQDATATRSTAFTPTPANVPAAGPRSWRASVPPRLAGFRRSDCPAPASSTCCRAPTRSATTTRSTRSNTVYHPDHNNLYWDGHRTCPKAKRASPFPTA